MRTIWTKLLAAAALKQLGERTLGFQKSGASVDAAQPRSTIQRKPLVPFTAVVYPVGVSTITSAASAMDAGAALRARAISVFSSAIRYFSRGAMDGYGDLSACARAGMVAPAKTARATDAKARK